MTGDQTHCRPKPLCMATDPASARLPLMGGPLDGCTAFVAVATERAGAFALVGGFYVADGRVWSWCESSDRSGSVTRTPTPRRKL